MLVAIEEVPVKPLGTLPEHLSLICLLASAIWTAVVCYTGWPGSAVALSFALPFALMLWEAKLAPRNRSVKFALLCAAIAIIGVAIEPGWFNMLVGWGVLLGTSLLLRKDVTLDAVTVAWNGVLHTFTSPFHFVAGLTLMVKLSGGLVRHMPRLPIAAFALPVVASAIFLGLLAISNPVIAETISSIGFLNLSGVFKILSSVFSPWALFIGISTGLLFWPMMQKNARLRSVAIAETGHVPIWHQVFFKPSAVATTLILLNLLFALQNALDVKYVWLTGELPKGMSFAQYAQKGAYSLIVTVLLAAVLIVFALRKDTPAAANKIVRALVYVWMAQNAALVASSMWRTLNYISEFGWTELRVSALIWMGLVCFGLITVVWRVQKNLSVLWLINTNIAAAVLLLALCAPLDIKDIVAERNVDRSIADSSKKLDHRYIRKLGFNALPALIRYKIHLENSKPVTLEEIAFRSAELSSIYMPLYHQDYHLRNVQVDWRIWSLRRALMVITP